MKDKPFTWRKNLDSKTNTIISHYLCIETRPEFIETIYKLNLFLQLIYFYN